MALSTAAAEAAPRQLSQKEADIQMMLAAEVHLGTKKCDYQMERYVFRRRDDARVSAAIENPKDIIVQCPVLKFAQCTGTDAIAGRHAPGTFTNHLHTSFSLLVLTDPRTDHQPIKEAPLGNIPTIALCDTDSPMRYVGIGIPGNYKGKHSSGCHNWILLSQEKLFISNSTIVILTSQTICF